MDPMKALSDAREATSTILRLRDLPDDELTQEIGDALCSAIDTLADSFQALDEWMSRGGFSPWTA